MGIAAQTGSANNSSSAVSSFAPPSFNVSAGSDVIVAVALGSTSSSVSSITDSAGSTYTLIAAINGTGIRTELWEAHNSPGQLANLISVNLSSATSIAVAAEAYAGVSLGGGTASASGATINMDVNINTVQGNDWIVSAMGFACQSGDTLTALCGTSRQSSIPSATAVGVALFDSAMAVDCTCMVMARISSARNWAVASWEMQSASASLVAADVLGSIVAAMPSSTALEQTFVDYGGHIVPNLSNAVITEKLTEPLFANQGPSNYGFAF